MNKSLLFLAAATLFPLLPQASTPLPRNGLAESNLREIRPGQLSRLRVAKAPAVSLPAQFPLLTQEDFDQAAVIDGNGDGKTWKFEKGYPDGAACYEGLGVSGAADDYLVLGPVSFNAPSGSYNLSLEAKQTARPETFEICLSPTGTAADAVTIYSCASVPNMNYGVLTSEFSTPAGEYYVMVHCNSPEWGISLYVRNIAIEAVAQEGFTVPFEMVPLATESRHFQFIDANEDGKTWKYDTANEGMAYEYSQTEAADDYLLFPEIEIPEAGNYKFSFDARCWGNGESVEVLFGQGDDPTQFTELFADPTVGTETYRREVVFTVAEPGLYRPALHCSSPANRYKLLTRNFRLEATDEAPARHLPVDFPDTREISAATSFTPSFILPDNSRVKITMEVKGDAVEVSMGNAPADAARQSLFTLDSTEEFTTVSRVISVAQGGIRYLGLNTEGEAQVRAITLQLVSEGDIYALPFSMQPTKEEYNEFQTVNANGDDGVWSYYEQFGAVRYNFSVDNDADDWLILPAVNIPSTDAMIRFAFNVRGMGESPKFTETYEVWEGETPDPASMRKIHTSPEIRNEAFTPMEFSFAPTHTGKTYLAVRATSKKNAFHLFLRDFVVEADGRQTTVPAPVSDLAATAAPMGSEQAIVRFTMPLLNEAGDNLGSDINLEATVTTSAETKTLIGKPGDPMNVEILNGQGYGNVTVTVSNTAGASNPATVRVYTGQDVPAPVTDLVVTCSEDNRTMTLRWTQPSEGANGGYADPAQMTYVIRHSSGGGSYTRVGETQGVCEYVYSIPESYPLAMHYLAVSGSNVAGECETPRGKGVMLGKPYEIPAMEEFADGEITLQPLAMDKPGEDYTLDWYFDNPAEALPEAANASGKALIAFTQEEGAARGSLHLPKFSTLTEDGARLVLRIYNHPHCAVTEVSALTFDGPVSIATIEPSDVAGWQTYSLPLPAELMNRQWIEPVIDFGFTGNHDDEIWMLDAYGMDNYFDHELTLRETAVHSSMVAQKETTWKFLASNYGREELTVTVPELNFTTLDGDVVSFPEATRPGQEVTLQPTESLELVYYVTLDAGMEGPLYYDLTLLPDNDADPDNNTVFGETELKVQFEYVVRDLTAERDGESSTVNLSWSAPRTDSGMLNCEGLTPWDYSTSLGLFTNLDLDGERVIGFSGQTFPGSGKPKAWQVWDYADAGFEYIYAGYQLSARSLIVFSPFDYNVSADDWLISPEVKGGTTLSFFVRPLHYAYGSETIEILTSATGDNVEDFTLLSTYLTKTGEADKTPYWEEVTADLPADARFFAIRYTSRDIFGLQLDDISYTPAQSDASQLTYSVLRDGEVIASGLTDRNYTDDFNGQATYYVAAEKNYGGLHPLSNRADVIPASGIDGINASGIKIATAPGQVIVTIPADITLDGQAILTAPDGKTISAAPLHTGRNTLSAAPGLYILTLPGHGSQKLLVP